MRSGGKVLGVKKDESTRTSMYRRRIGGRMCEEIDADKNEKRKDCSA